MNTSTYNAKSSGDNRDCMRLQDQARCDLFNLSNKGVFPSVSISAFFAIEECFVRDANQVRGITVSECDNNLWAGLCDASTPWNTGTTGAAIFPEQFQPWESDTESFIVAFDGVYTLTFQGEIAFENFSKQERAAILAIN